MNTKSAVHAALLCVLVALDVCHAGLPRIKFTVEVVDETGQPVSDANVAIGLNHLLSDQDGFDVQTDSVGKAQVEGEFSKIGGIISKTGYYRTEITVETAGLFPEGVEIGRRLPPAQRRFVLRPVVNPVPMYAYRYFSYLPAEETEVGFDFIRADWVAPHGMGVTNDLMIRIMKYTAAEDGMVGGEITWRFPRPGDGMVRVPREDLHLYSDCRLPRYAPESGYIAAWTSRLTRASSVVWTTVTDPPGQNFKVPSYFFRIRSMQDVNGVVTNAFYGKIPALGSNGIDWSYVFQNSKSYIHFLFFVNPDGTRNMEFDPQRNLFNEMIGTGKIERLRIINFGP